MTTPAADIRAAQHGSVTLLHWQTPAGREWLAKNVDAADWAWLGEDGIVAEWRAAQAIVEGARAEGLIVDDGTPSE